jgi:site-specific recombinase XerD
VLLSTCIEDYLEDCYGLASGTQDLYRYHLERLLADAGDCEMDDLTPRAMRHWIGGLRCQDGGKYSACYLDQVYRTVNTFCKWCVLEGTLQSNPMERVRRPRVPKRKSPRLSLAEVERMLAAVRGTMHAARNLAMVCLAVDSGLRRSEILKLKVKDVDLGRGVVRVLGKGGRERVVPIGQATREALRAYLAARPASSSSRAFVISAGRPLTVDGMQTLMYRLKARAGLPQLRWHLLRHTFANLFIENGGGLRQLQAILGHSDIRTTAGIYTDPDLPELQRCHARSSPLMNMEWRVP